jgi:phosphatidylserine/phosphatidylglycerophosphate/cardiolipin synthase-like enzyme
MSNQFKNSMQKYHLLRDTAAAHGCERVVTTPGNRLPDWAGSTYIEQIVTAGVRVLLYEKRYRRTKTISIDSEICSSGSANVDIRSINYERHAVFYSQHIAKVRREPSSETSNVTTVNTLGPSFVKPSVYLSPMAHAISKTPATIKLIHAIVDSSATSSHSTNLRRDSFEMIQMRIRRFATDEPAAGVFVSYHWSFHTPLTSSPIAMALPYSFLS